MDIKSNFAILTEMASIDNSINTRSKVELDAVKEAYETIPTAESYVVTEAVDVIVNNINGSYYVEMVNLSPFMQDAGLTSIAKALDLVAEANNMEPKSVGLVVESQGMINAILANADAKSKSTGNHKIRENAITKVQKDVAIVNKLLNEGYKVAKKGDKDKGNKVCPDCGKAKCKCECGSSCGKGSKKECDAPGSNTGKAVIAECDDKGKPLKEQVEYDDRIANIFESAFDGYDLETISEAQLISCIQEAAIKSKEDVEQRLKALDNKNASAADYNHAFTTDVAKILAHLGVFVASFGGGTAAGTGVGKIIKKAGEKKLSKELAKGTIDGIKNAGKIATKTTHAANYLSGATAFSVAFIISIAAFYAISTMTRIFRCPGSISDNLVYARKVNKEFAKAIAKYEKAGDEEMTKKCRDAKAKVEKKLAELEKQGEGKSKVYQNLHDAKGNNLGLQNNQPKK